MKYKRLEPQIDLNDPQAGFSFSSDRDPVELSFVDWTNRKITFRFFTTYVFVYRMAAAYKSLPQAQVLEILNSEPIKSLREDCTASADEELHHFVISTNEDEWCEIVAQRYELEEKKKE